MASLIADCPHAHCRLTAVPFRVVANYRRLRIEEVVSFCVCLRCDMPVAFVLVPSAVGVSARWMVSAEACGDHDLLQASSWRIKEMLPKVVVKGAPDYVPPNISRLYRQARIAVSRQEPETAKLLFREAVERAAKVLDSVSTGCLLERIDRLAAQGQVPESVRVWAHELDLTSEYSAQVEKCGNPDLAALGDFTETFLLSAFTVAAKVAVRRTRSIAGEAKASPVPL